MSTDDISLFRQNLTSNGYRVTKPREDTFRLLVSPEPQSMNELLHKSAGNIDRVTTYRTIDVFEKIGLVHRIYIGWKYKLELSDQFLRHHHHISCLSCGTVIDIEDEQHIDEFIRKIAEEFGFAPRSHNFEIDGYCANCQKSSHKS
jgi:Fur family ferric uptake transcriptional regulator